MTLGCCGCNSGFCHVFSSFGSKQVLWFGCSCTMDISPNNRRVLYVYIYMRKRKKNSMKCLLDMLHICKQFVSQTDVYVSYRGFCQRYYENFSSVLVGILLKVSSNSFKTFSASGVLEKPKCVCEVLSQITHTFLTVILNV